MSISYQTIIEKMKRELNDIDDHTSEKDIHSKMYAIQSLADVVLSSKGDGFSSKPVENYAPEKAETESEVSDMEARAMGLKKPSKSQNRLDEQDANGESIFDF
ncbi:hypothetical protein CEY16_10610 [Halalkalibacillus sediminis]|uniref:Uncharacterized protein n=1 Tax=Halalkalibacillus sediminis TaxID=2018042 RepID=A0A2I0QS96_9BACI|nr:YwdI family protein [Halalkalibacillus sediminis]PKR77184.1 hypothetical protein CEY16_10610 [Halalkalibacillus sediminis]